MLARSIYLRYPFTYSLFVDVKECENNKCLCSLSDIVEQAEIIDGDCL